MLSLRAGTLREAKDYDELLKNTSCERFVVLVEITSTKKILQKMISVIVVLQDANVLISSMYC